ncbi:MAG: SDR family oxidoreductase [Chloroflexi bacterium]|nr:SDR family oxidoreductase [Chloroflexota bacterium]
MDLGLRGKVALITGGSRGLGRAVTHALAAEGASVAACARNQADLDALAAELAARGGQAFVMPADCTRTPDVQTFVDAVLGRFGRVDVLVNSLIGPKAAPFVQLSDEEWLEALNGKLLGHIRCARAVFPHMVRQGGGRIINIVGNWGIQPLAAAIMASVVNAGLLNFTKALAELGAPHAVLVNAVNPGPSDTDRIRGIIQQRAAMLGKSPDEVRQSVVADVPLQRLGRPEEIAAVIAFLASERASYVTGALYDIDGGQTRCI